MSDRIKKRRAAVRANSLDEPPRTRVRFNTRRAGSRAISTDDNIVVRSSSADDIHNGIISAQPFVRLIRMPSAGLLPIIESPNDEPVELILIADSSIDESNIDDETNNDNSIPGVTSDNSVAIAVAVPPSDESNVAVAAFQSDDHNTATISEQAVAQINDDNFVAVIPLDVQSQREESHVTTNNDGCHL